ncbi:hypothetical protein BH10ACI2_BH10ACI2_10020 [soil metagenome]
MSVPTKQYHLTFTVHPEYIYAHLSGDRISVEIIRDYIADIVAKSDETDRYRILLFRDIPASLSGGETFYTVSESLAALRGKKLALVNPHAALESEVEFGVTVGQNRGGNYRSFNNVPAAEAWLLGGIE